MGNAASITHKMDIFGLREDLFQSLAIAQIGWVVINPNTSCFIQLRGAILIDQFKDPIRVGGQGFAWLPIGLEFPTLEAPIGLNRFGKGSGIIHRQSAALIENIDNKVRFRCGDALGVEAQQISKKRGPATRAPSDKDTSVYCQITAPEACWSATKQHWLTGLLPISWYVKPVDINACAPSQPGANMSGAGTNMLS